ncbi:MAG: hypothetical protein U0W40_04210 [Acidimicrobiia bacterium]
MGTFQPSAGGKGCSSARSALSWAPGDEDGRQASINYLNGRMVSIAGTNEMQRNGIDVLGLLGKRPDQALRRGRPRRSELVGKVG